jgi:hypothetical protein
LALFKAVAHPGPGFFIAAAKRSKRRSLAAVGQNTKIIILSLVYGGYLD